MSDPAPSLGIDLDGTIDESPAFFAALTHSWPGRVTVVTFRDDRAKAAADLAGHGVRYDELVLVERFDAKPQVIAEKGIDVYFDDQDEMLQGVAEAVTVFKIRNGGNFDHAGRQWLYSKRTGREL